MIDLKKEISERDNTIQDKERRIYELKRKKQELEKYKFVLNYKITELKNQVSGGLTFINTTFSTTYSYLRDRRPSLSSALIICS